MARDDQVRLFRVDQHAARLNRSCEQLCIPPLDQQVVEDSIAAIVDADREWVPHKRGTSLYIRPTVIATETFLGVHPSHTYLYYVILSPVGAYYKEGLNPVRIMVSEDHVRAVPGGLGSAKTAGNYAASLSAARDAERAGFTQVLYLDGRKREFLDEVGTMNIMLRIGDRVLTPPLSSGSILAGVTRSSVLQLLADWGVETEERPSVDPRGRRRPQERPAPRDVGHRHGGGDLTGRRARLWRRSHVDQQGRDRRTDPEAVRYRDRDPIRARPTTPITGPAASADRFATTKTPACRIQMWT